MSNLPRLFFVARLIFTTFLFVFAAEHVVAQTSGRQLTQGPNSETARKVRIALVIGNGGYKSAKPLRNPPSDARIIAATMQDLGFEVISGVDKSQREMKQMIRDFGQRLRTSGAVGVFYYAGHGVQAKGTNYLVPVDADIQTESDLEDQGVDINYVLNLMYEAQNSLNIVILDACRNNPFVRSFRGSQDGLAQVKAPTRTLIAYATAPDQIAADGEGVNSPYTQELIQQMRTPGVLIETMFRRVAEQVSARTTGHQEPWFSANIKGDFYFKDGMASSLTEKQPDAASPRNDAATVELTFWESIRNSNDPQDFRSYLDKYPYGQFVSLARNNLTRLSPRPTGPPLTSTPGNANDSESKAKADDLSRRNAAIIEENRRITAANEIVSDSFKNGNSALTAKNYDEAIRQYDSGLAADPDHPGAPSLLTNKSEALRARGVERFNRAVASKDVSAKSAGLEMAKSDFKASAEAANRAVELLNKKPQPSDAEEQRQHNVNKYFALKSRAEAMRLFVAKVDQSQSEAALNAFQEYIAVETDSAKRLKSPNGRGPDVVGCEFV